MDFKTINSQEAFEQALHENKAVLFYFSTLSCSVAETLQPKIMELLKTDYPRMSFYFVDMQFNAGLSASCNVFVEPTVLVYFHGKESIRKSRNFGISELSNAIHRLYQFTFSD
jgi:thioredoxin 1